MKKILLILILFTLVGCFDDIESGPTVKSGNKVFNTICIDDVQYIYYMDGYFSVKFNSDGTVSTCP